MNKGEFNSLQIGTRVKVNESALIRTGHTPLGKPILRWEHYMSLKVEDKK